MCSTARVVSVGLSTDDEPSLTDDNEETFMTSHPGTRTPQAAFVRGLGWDEDEPFISAYPSLQRPVHGFNDSHREVQPPTVRGHVSTDERTPLLSRVSEAPSTPRHPPNSVPLKPTAIRQSTFSQTVSSRVLFEFIVFDVWSAFQCNRPVTWHRHALRASCVLICGVDLWDFAHRPLRYHHVLYVRHTIEYSTVPRLMVPLTSIS
jgi:hypothetical protein